MEKSILDRKVKVGGPYLSVISALKWVEANKSLQVLGQSGYTEKEKQKTTTTNKKETSQFASYWSSLYKNQVVDTMELMTFSVNTEEMQTNTPTLQQTPRKHIILGNVFLNRPLIKKKGKFY